MKIPFVSFVPMEKELNDDLRGAFDRVFTRSWYIEGVEDEAQIETLKQIGCDYIQGYVWGRPMPKDEALEIVFS